MTRVCYDRAGLLLRMEGHAQAGPEGQDLVCAALSMLMMALERRILTQTAVSDYALICAKYPTGSSCACS